MCKSWCQPFILGAHYYLDFIGHGVGLSFWRRVVLSLFVCLFVSTPKVGDYFVFKSHKWVRFSCFFVLFCFVFPSKCSISPPYLGSGWLFFCLVVGKVFCFLLFLFVCLFAFILFCFVLFLFLFFFCLPKISHPPLISKYGAPLSLFYYTNDGGHYVIDNFEFHVTCVQFSEKSNFNLKLH